MDKKEVDLKNKIADLEREIEKVKSGEGKKKAKKIENLAPQEVLYSWTALSRVFVERDKKWFLVISFFALLLILFFAFLQDIMIILVICTSVLILFLLASIKPGEVNHLISNKGLDSIEEHYKWENLKEFWVSEKFNQKVMHVSTNIHFPSELVLLLGRNDELKVVDLMANFLPYKEYNPKEGWLTKITDGLMVNPEHYYNILVTKHKDFKFKSIVKNQVPLEEKNVKEDKKRKFFFFNRK